ncbi:MAG: SDR family oxidoreductase [Ruminococcaceae bacterium]|nr:SDR family oxidoreductase [Oscillospiraceae bacterium]
MLPFSINLSDKVVVITGGGGVLCGQFAHAVASCGAKTVILDLQKDKAEQVAAKIRDKGGKALALSANVLEKESLEKAREAVLEHFGTCDILINGAGGNSPKGSTTLEFYNPGDEKNKDIISFFDLDPDGVSFVFDLNFLGTLLPTQVFAKDMAGKRGASILNISSMNAFSPLTKIPAYSAAKAAISNFTAWLAVHFAKAGIRVNALAPGFFVTEQNKKLLFDEAGRPTSRTQKILSQTPMGRFGEPEELVGTLLWLLSPGASSFVTGTVIPIDGGFSAYSGV